MDGREELRKMKQTILILCLSTVLLLGCRSDKASHDNGVVRFTAYQPTKVTGTSFDVNDEITVFAPLSGEAIDGRYDTEGVGPAKNKIHVADQANTFLPKNESDRISYSTSTQKLDFYAVYPATGPAPKNAGVNLDTYMIELGNMTDQTGRGNVVPYMYSNDAKEKGMGSGVVPLTFRYVFSKISLKVVYDAVAMGDTLSKVEFFATDGLKSECVIDLKRGNYTRLAYGVGLDAVEGSPYLFRAPARDDNEVEGYIVPSTTHFPIIRLTFGDSAPTITTGGGSVADAKVFLCKIAVGGTGEYVFAAGKEYKYEIQINGSEVSLGGTIEDWDPAGVIHIEAT